jgi:hypothetical protein
LGLKENSYAETWELPKLIMSSFLAGMSSIRVL